MNPENTPGSSSFLLLISDMKINLTKTNIILISLLVVLGAFSVFAWSQICLPKDEHASSKHLFEVSKGEDVLEIAGKLEDEGIINDDLFFIFYVFFMNKQNQLKAGKYFVSPSESIFDISQKFILGEIAQAEITIPEGFTISQTTERLIEKKLVKGSEFEELAVGYFHEEFSFLNEISSEESLEGFLFPDTYQFSYENSVEEIAGRMLANFNRKLTASLRDEIIRQNKTIFEIITMASLLEKEVRTLDDKKIVSGILWKRLEYSIPLQVDATIIYILSDSEKYPERYITGKKTTKVLIEETEINSPYNTYKYLGLPKGPICNPGLESIQAALYPKDSSYWYYLSTPEGDTKFSATLGEHNAKKREFLNYEGD